jgi:formylglycine-generating enzyme required for sulfatase activity
VHRFVQVEALAQNKGVRLRVLLRIDASARELQALRWELLAHPVMDTCLTTSESLLMSRFMASSDWRSVQLRDKTDLRALIAISAPEPDNLRKMRLAPVDFVAEKRTIERTLAKAEVAVLGGPAVPMTLDALVAELRKDVDIVYLVSHGKFGRTRNDAALVLQDETGAGKWVEVDEVARRIAELRRPPRLMVLISCQSAGDGGQVDPEHGTTVQATLAARLADAGVPAILAMQGRISMATIDAMMPTFFAELLRDGRVDRALAVARSRVWERDDAWMPTLFMRLQDGRLWSDEELRDSPPAAAEPLAPATAVPAPRALKLPGPLMLGAFGLVALLGVGLVWALVRDSKPVTEPDEPPEVEPPEVEPPEVEPTLVVGGPSGRPWTSTSTGIHFIELEPATFQMGSPEDEPGHKAGERLHAVKISQSFFIAATEVTQGQWTKLMGSNPSLCEFGCGDELPVQNITWCDALRFLNEMSKADGFEPAYAIPPNCEQGGEVEWNTTVDSYRLPTEAEWEYAARAGTTTAYSFGAQSQSICSYANLGRDFVGCDDEHAYTAPVMAFPPNAWGLYEVHGNVWEWVWDRHGDYPEGIVVDPIGPSTGDKRSLRGGSFINEPADIRSATRHWDPPNFKLNRIGLRCARGAIPPK